MIKGFDVEIDRRIDISKLSWPDRGEARTDYGLGGNRHYSDLRRCSWRSAKEMFDYEISLLKRIEQSRDCTFLEDGEESDDIAEALWGLDVGVASSVIALSAARCIPCSSCNGSAFGNGHLESYPLVAFYAKPLWIPHLIAAAEAASVGLENGHSGSVVLFASDIRNMPRFASSVIERRRTFAQLKLTGPRKRSAGCPVQLQFAMLTQ